MKSVYDQISFELRMMIEEEKRFLDVCLSITSERDREALLGSILDAAMEIAHCDAGTLYLLQNDSLHFCRMITLSLNIREGEGGAPISLPPVPMEESYVCAWAALHRETLNVADVRKEDRFDFGGFARYDERTGYQTVSMLVVPMSNDTGELIGVMQLINAIDEKGQIIPFATEKEGLLSALSSLAAISISNMRYRQQVSGLLDSLVLAFSKTIDERSHYTANHTEHMAEMAENFLTWLECSGEDWPFDENRRRAFLMSIRLHDVGKLAIPLTVMDKSTRLGDRLADVEQRFRIISLLAALASLKGDLAREDFEEVSRQLESCSDFIKRINGGCRLSEEDKQFIENMSHFTWPDEKGEPFFWITPEEKECLLIEAGTLTGPERNVMQSHVSITEDILTQVDFPSLFAEVPIWASLHHEFLNGSGYPKKLSGEEIPREARLLTILDVFEAMTAKDRPYKTPKTVEETFDALDFMVRQGKVDEKVLSLFKASRAWEGVL